MIKCKYKYYKVDPRSPENKYFKTPFLPASQLMQQP